MSESNGVNNSVHILLEKVCKSEKMDNAKFIINQATAKGDGYISDIYRVKIISGNKQLNVIVKIAPNSEMFRKLINIKQVYLNEIYFYDVIYPIFHNFQTEKEVENPFCVAKCYATSTYDMCEGLVLENLKDQGYQLWNRRLPMNTGHISFVLNELGRFHAISFALRDQNKDLYEELSGKVIDMYEEFSKNEDNNKSFVENLKKLLEDFDNENDKDAHERFGNYIKTCLDDDRKFTAKNMDQYTVIAHGDGWSNNMLFKYQDADNPISPLKMKLLDFQIIRKVSPVIDVFHFFYTSSSKEILDNYQHYMNFYYDNLFTHIKKLGSDPEKVYPRKKFEEHCKTYRTHGLTIAICMLKAMLSESEEIPDFVEAAESAGNIMGAMNYQPQNSNYKVRIRDTILHFAENKFI